jgi:NAD(P)H dehydrogenase (quinone)
LFFNSWTKAFPSPPWCIKQISEAHAGSAKGADIVVGSLTDINDMRTAMAGARRAYFCVPNEAGNLKAAAIFTVVAASQKVEAVVAMSQWLSNPNHPSVHTREVWLADRLFELLPGTAVTFINPGFFRGQRDASLTFRRSIWAFVLALWHRPERASFQRRYGPCCG